MAGYIGPIPVPQATQSRETFTATASQNSFGTAGYQVGYLDVFMNGVKLAPADFTATNGSDVVLASGAAVNDIIEVVSYSAFEVLNQNFTGTTVVDNLTVGGNLTVDGTTTTINSTTLNVDDINITVASGAADSAAANGAGLTVDGAGATFNYSHSGTKWTMNKPLDVGGAVTADGLNITTATSSAATLENTGNSGTTFNFDANRSNVNGWLGSNAYKWDGTLVAQISGATGSDTTNKDDGTLLFYTAAAGTILARQKISNNGDISFYATDGTTQAFHWGASTENLNIGAVSSQTSYKLHVTGTAGSDSGDVTTRIEAGTASSNSAVNHATLDLTAKAKTSGGTALAQNTEIRSLGNASGHGGTLAFYTDNSSAAITERMRVTSAGIVEMYGNSSSTLHLKSSSPILAFTDTNSFPDANDRFQIRGTSSDGIAAGSMGFYDSSANATSTYFTIRDDGKIGIRNTTPFAIGLQIGGDPSGTVAPSMSISLQDGGGTNTSLAIRGGSPTIFFDQTGGGNGKFLMDSADIAFKSGSMQSEGSERVRIRWDGGITFNGDTATANALNDYEEGTWLPTLEFQTAGSTATVANSVYTTGSYTKIGQAVTVQFNITGITFGNGTGYVRFLGLPFTPNGISAYAGKNQASSGHLTAANTASSYSNVLKIYGVNPIQLWYSLDAGTTGFQQMTNSNASTVAPNSINGSFTYYTNS